MQASHIKEVFLLLNGTDRLHHWDLCAAQDKQEEAEAEERSSQEVDMGAYA